MHAPSLRPFPYPYRAALSICSDIDGTDSKVEFLEIQSFMNEEIGIKFSNSFFPYHDENKFSLLSSNIEDGETIIENIKNGQIDSIHSYGEKKDFCREDAVRALEILTKKKCELEIWIDHAKSLSNLSKFWFEGKGDLPGEREYHFDITKKLGIKYIWTERLTNIIGQGVPLNVKNLLAIYDNSHPISSSTQLFKTLCKIILSKIGSKRYSHFRNNRLLNVVTLNDGQKVYEFVRFNNYFRGPGKGDSFEHLHYLISPNVLSHLKISGGYSIVYVHLGRNFYLESQEGKKTIEALKNLKNEFDKGRIYVDSTKNILNHYITTKYLDWTSDVKNGISFIHIKSISDPLFGIYIPKSTDLKNISFYVSGEVRLFINSQAINNFKYNPPDFTRRESITIL